MKKEYHISVLFICLGNICRSPIAEAVFRRDLSRARLGNLVLTDSAGIEGKHQGKEPDRRAQEIAAKRGLNLSDLRSRQVTKSDFSRFDYLLAMDEANLAELNRIKPKECAASLDLFLNYSEGKVGRSVPDPYFGGADDFEQVFDIIELGSSSLLDRIRRDSLGN